jgi:hypothetical protein
MDCTFSNPFSANIFTNWLLGASTASVMLLAFKRTNFFLIFRRVDALHNHNHIFA